MTKLQKSLEFHWNEILSGRDNESLKKTQTSFGSEKKDILNYARLNFEYLKGNCDYMYEKCEEYKDTNKIIYNFLSIRKTWQTYDYFKAKIEFDEFNFEEELTICGYINPFWELEYAQLNATIYLGVGEYKKAITEYEKVIRIGQEVGLHERVARASHSLFICFQETRNNFGVQSALKTLKSACDAGNIVYVKVLYLSAKANLHFISGEYEKTEKYLTESLTILEEDEWSNNQMNSLMMLGYLLLRIGKFKEYHEIINKMKEINQVRKSSLLRDMIPILELNYFVRNFNWVQANKIIYSLKGHTLDYYDNIALCLQKLKVATGSKLNEKFKDILTFKEESLLRNEIIKYEDAEDAILPELILYDIKRTPAKDFQTKIKKLRYQSSLHKRPYLEFKISLIALTLSIFSDKDEVVLAELGTIIELTNKYKLPFDEYIYLGITNDMCKKFNFVMKSKHKERFHYLQEEYGLIYKDQINSWPFTHLFKRGNDYLLIDTVSQFFTYGQMNKVPFPESKNMSLFFEILYKKANQVVSFESLCYALYEEEYNPLIHQQRIYNLVDRVKKYLDSTNIPINVLENFPGQGYLLKCKVYSKKISKLEKLSLFIENFPLDYNLTAKDFVEKFEYTNRQAQRDIKRLEEAGLIKSASKRGHYLIQ